MKNIRVGQRVKVKQGTVKRVRQSSMTHWKLCPDIDGLVFTVKKLSANSKGCWIDHHSLPYGVYELPETMLEPA